LYKRIYIERIKQKRIKQKIHPVSL